MKKMKRLLYFVVVVTFTTSIIISCGKTTKGKMDGEWTISSMEESDVDLDTSPSDTYTTTIDGSIITETDVSGGTTTTDTGVVNEAKWKIKKDGKWEQTIVTTFTFGSNTYRETKSRSGNWNFLNSVSKDYKKNERVLFNVLEEKKILSTTSGGTTTSNTDSHSYYDGEESFIYVVTESTKNTLVLNLDGARSSFTIYGGSTYTHKTTTKSTYSLTK